MASEPFSDASIETGVLPCSLFNGLAAFESQAQRYDKELKPRSPDFSASVLGV